MFYTQMLFVHLVIIARINSSVLNGKKGQCKFDKSNVLHFDSTKMYKGILIEFSISHENLLNAYYIVNITEYIIVVT